MATEFQEFEDVTIYTPDTIWANILRIDARRARVWIAPYAQHEERVYANFVRRGKRKDETLVSDYVVVVPAMQAITPDGLYLPFVDGSAPARYGITDPRWRTDFEEKLRQAGVPVLADYRRLQSDAKPLESRGEEREALDKQISTPMGNSSTNKNGETIDFEEGVRYQAERSFFQRNPRLAEEAKKLYRCICQACEFDFVSKYGDLGANFAEVHHLNPLSERPPEEWTNVLLTNVADVAVLCANCHRMIHRRKPALSIEEIRAALSRAKRG